MKRKLPVRIIQLVKKDGSGGSYYTCHAINFRSAWLLFKKNCRSLSSGLNAKDFEAVYHAPVKKMNRAQTAWVNIYKMGVPDDVVKRSGKIHILTKFSEDE